MDPLKRKTALAMVNVFETGQPRGDYGNITLLKGDPGHLTYGRSQTTLASGNLYKLVQGYCAMPHAQFAARLTEYLPRLQARDLSLDNDARLKRILKAAGETDPVMRQAQDLFFDAVYWMPANDIAYRLGVQTPLGVAIIYDSTVHGSFARIRKKVDAKVGTIHEAGEKTWMAAYVATRRAWLAGHSITILRKTVYRMDTFGALIRAGNWTLDLPIIAHGVKITQEKL